MAGRCDGCGDPNIPTVNNEAKECCELTPTNCVVTSEYQDYFKIGKGKTLTYAINKIAKVVKAIKGTLDDLLLYNNYKSYIATLDQVATGNPVASNVQNKFTVTPTFTRTNPGKYSVTLTGAFTAGKTVIDIKEFNIGWGEKVKAYRVDVNTVAIETGSTTDYIDDDVMNNMPIEIKVYN